MQLVEGYEKNAVFSPELDGGNVYFFPCEAWYRHAFFYCLHNLTYEWVIMRRILALHEHHYLHVQIYIICTGGNNHISEARAVCLHKPAKKARRRATQALRMELHK